MREKCFMKCFSFYGKKKVLYSIFKFFVSLERGSVFQNSGDVGWYTAGTWR